MKRLLGWIGIVVGSLLALVAVYVVIAVVRFNTSMDRVYPIAAPAVAHSTDPAVVARGAHLARSVAGCALEACHGADMAGGSPLAMGPVGTFTAPNVSALVAGYSDGELVRLMRHGLRKDGRSLRFMPVGDFNWLPEADFEAIVSWLRTVPASSRPSAPVSVGLLGKVLDRREQMVIDVARHLNHDAPSTDEAPAPTVAYGKQLAQLCSGCHGEGFSGGPIPGAPSSMAVPRNLTPDPSGLAEWTYADFVRMAEHGVRKNGQPMDPLMPTEAIRNMNETERQALWAFLRSLPPRPSGQR